MLDLAHLEPMRITCMVNKIGRALVIDAKFSNHCFTKTFINGEDDPNLKIMDHKNERAFCPDRYACSKLLPDMVRFLPKTPVFQTKTERNYVYIAVLSDGSGRPYPMFFQIARANYSGVDLALMVESAYPVDGYKSQELLKGANKVAFAVLCTKVVKGEPLRFNTRR